MDGCAASAVTGCEDACKLCWHNHPTHHQSVSILEQQPVVGATVYLRNVQAGQLCQLAEAARQRRGQSIDKTQTLQALQHGDPCRDAAKCKRWLHFTTWLIHAVHLQQQALPG